MVGEGEEERPFTPQEGRDGMDSGDGENNRGLRAKTNANTPYNTASSTGTGTQKAKSKKAKKKKKAITKTPAQKRLLLDLDND